MTSTPCPRLDPDGPGEDHLVALAPARGPIPRDLDPVLNRLARRAAAGDERSAALLWAAFQPRAVAIVADQCRRLHVLPGDVVEPDDLQQEAWLLVRTIVERWDGTGNIVPRLLVALRWRTRDRIRLLRRGLPCEGHPVGHRRAPLGEPGDERTRALALLEEIAAPFAPVVRDLVMLVVLEERSLAAAARELGIAERSARRHWAAVRLATRRLVEDA